MGLTTGRAVGNHILKLCEERHISVNRLSTICGITQSTLNNIVNGGSKNPTVSTVQKVCDGLGITMAEFFSDPIFESAQPTKR